MTDEALIARLRGVWRYKDLHLCPEAADRIEALLAERDEYHSEAMNYIEKWGAARKAQDEAEAKLAKAVEALEEISEYDTGATAGLAYTAKHHLAVIKGESQDGMV